MFTQLSPHYNQGLWTKVKKVQLNTNSFQIDFFKLSTLILQLVVKGDSF